MTMLGRFVTRAIVFVLAAAVASLTGCGAFKVSDRTGNLTTCPVHEVVLQEETLRIAFGTMHHDLEALHAQMALFPYANTEATGGCIVTDRSPWWARVQYCTSCRQAEQAWFDERKAQHAAAQ